MLPIRLIACLLLLLSGAVQAQDALPSVDQQAVAKLLEERCASCHAPGSDDAKALRKWGGALDLAATAADEQVVVRGDIDESELYQLIEFEEMPPVNSDIPMLDEAEKAVIANWIKNGAPVTIASDQPEGSEPTPAEDPMNPVLKWLSHFHPTMVHFPVALLIAAFIAQSLFSLRPGWKTDIAASFCLALGALSSIPTALLGWQLAVGRSSGGDELFNHRWLGVSTAVISLGIWWAYHRWPTRRLPLLLLLAILVSATGHTGGILSYGANWLKPPF